MKKSTLITTIAMIVVVVVALSTATYAWFTSSQTTVAEMTVSTTAQTGWALLVNTAAIGESSAKYQENEATAKAMTFSGTQGISVLNAGLWCPTSEVTATLSSNTNVCTYKPGVRFFSAKQDNLEAFTLITVDDTPKFYQSEVIRVSNASSSAQQGDLKITISFPKSNSEGDPITIASAVAAAGLRFVIVGTNGETSSVVAETDYTIATEATVRGGSTAIGGINSMEHDGTYTATYNTHTASTAFAAKPNLSAAASITTNAETASGGFQYAATADANYGIAATSFYAQYTYTTVSIPAGQGMNYAIYYWLDGGVLSTEAGAANISLHFSIESHS